MNNNPVSPKVKASTLAAALASAAMVIVTVVWPDALTESQVAIIQGALVTVLTALGGWLITDPRRSRMKIYPDRTIAALEQQTGAPVDPTQTLPSSDGGETTQDLGGERS